MGKTVTEKLLAAHLVEGNLQKGEEIGIRIDQTLTQDATGTMAYLEFEATGISDACCQRTHGLYFSRHSRAFRIFNRFIFSALSGLPSIIAANT